MEIKVILKDWIVVAVVLIICFSPDHQADDNGKGPKGFYQNP